MNAVAPPITAKLREHMWIEELIEVAESKASCELYGILNRPEKTCPGVHRSS